MKPYQHTVQYYETDRMGITHHSNYIRWMEEARVDFLAQLGWNLERLEAMGAVSPVTALDVKYRHDTKFPEVISIQVSLTKFTGIRLRLGTSCACLRRFQPLPRPCRRWWRRDPWHWQGIDFPNPLFYAPKKHGTGDLPGWHRLGSHCVEQIYQVLGKRR